MERMQQSRSGTFAPANHRFFKNGKERTGGQGRRGEQKQKRSKSSSFRNRSLKQLFGDIPAINEYLSCQITDKPKQTIKQKVTHNAVNHASNKQQIDDQYLIKHKEKTKFTKSKGVQKIIHKRQEERYKRINKEYDKLVNSTASSQKAQTDCGFYDPNAYKWRKTPSKQKDLQFGKQSGNSAAPSKINEIQKDPQMVQSQYYGTPRHTRHSQIGIDNINAKQTLKLAKMRASSIQLKKQKASKLKPKVAKHVFEIKSPKNKHHSLTPNKSLFFTFGI